MKLYRIISKILILLLVSCSNENDSNIDVSEGNDVKLEPKQFSSFLIPVKDPPSTISKIASGLYSSPTTPYGVGANIDFILNDDNTVDIFWKGSNSGKRFLYKVSLENQSLLRSITLPTQVNLNSPRSLGIESLGGGKYIVGYSKDNSFGDKNAEAWYTAFNGDTGEELYSIMLWGRKNLNDVWSKGLPKQAGNAVLKFDKSNNTVLIYLAHTQKWDDGIRHQAGWLGFLNAETGKLVKNSEGKNIGNGWFYSHNFNQRAIVTDDGSFYALAHGDAFPRALGISKWISNKGKIFSKEYYKIKNGKTGNNVTETTTGDIIELSNGNLAIIFSTKDDRKSRDLKIVIVNKITGDKINEEWITQENNMVVGWGMKLAKYDNDKIILGWNTFEGNNGKGTHFVVTDLTGKRISNIYSISKTELYPSQSFKITKDGKNIIYVSVDGNNLKVNKISINN